MSMVRAVAPLRLSLPLRHAFINMLHAHHMTHSAGSVTSTDRTLSPLSPFLLSSARRVQCQSVRAADGAVSVRERRGGAAAVGTMGDWLADWLDAGWMRPAVDWMDDWNGPRLPSPPLPWRITWHPLDGPDAVVERDAGTMDDGTIRGVDGADGCRAGRDGDGDGQRTGGRADSRWKGYCLLLPVFPGLVLHKLADPPPRRQPRSPQKAAVQTVFAEGWPTCLRQPGRRERERRPRRRHRENSEKSRPEADRRQRGGSVDPTTEEG